MSRPIRIGLTGGIASGKSTVADLFAEQGIVIVDTDIIAREVVEPGTPALAEIRRDFGESVLQANGSLDRAAMRKIIFSDDTARIRLEAILHPRIQTETLRQADAATGDYILIAVPLMVESALREQMDRILVVDCDESVQIERLLDRDTETEDQARRILAAQASREQRLAIADDVIQNNSTLEALAAQVATLHKRYLEIAP